MLNEQQLEILSDVIRPLFQSLERDVIMDIARRVEETMTYTQTAEVMAEQMQQLGYSPNKIRKEVMKILGADKEYQKAVEKNTIEYKKEIKKLVEEYTQEAKNLGKDIISDAGQMSWNEDLALWKSGGKKLEDNSFLQQLQDAIAEQTVEEFVNLTRTTGFKTMSGYEKIGNAFRNELDKAAIKICTGTFSQDQVVSDVVHNLAKSGLRSINFESGYSMQLDTAVKNALRTGCAQISAKIMDENMRRTGENLVYVSKHWGARNKGAGVENHELWQGQVYFVVPGRDYSEEANRIGQDRIMDIWYSTGYSPDGSHPNIPLGLHGYYCRHSHRVWFEGVSDFPPEHNQEEPGPVEINGKMYDYYARTQMQRAMERNIRALKRERVARVDLNMPTTEISKRIKQKIREYEEFCEKYNMPEDANRFRMDSKAVDITKTKAYREYEQLKNDMISYEDEDIFKSIVNRISGKKDDVFTEFENGLKDVKDDNVRILLTQAKSRTTFEEWKKKRSSYSSKNHTVYYGKGAVGSTIAHELFHEIYDTYRLYDDEFITNSLKNDFDRLINNASARNESLIGYLFSKYPEAFYVNSELQIRIHEKYRGISDIVHGLTKGKVFLGYGHSEKGYWQKYKILENETFAQFGRIMYNQDEQVIGMFKELFTETNQEIIERLEGMAK